MRTRTGILILMLGVFGMGCIRVPPDIHPILTPPPHPKEVQRETRCFLSLPKDFSVSPFPPLTETERATDWGKEYLIGLFFGADFDLYRAITAFKRASFLLQAPSTARGLEVEYMIVLAYYLGHKYNEVIFQVESTPLAKVEDSFPAFSDLIVLLYDSYEQMGKSEHAAHLLKLLEQKEGEKARKLNLLATLKQVNLQALGTRYEKIIGGYQSEAKSIKKAQLLNAFLPGAGYWYVGLRQTAITAFLINSLFIAASAHLFTQGHGAAAAIVLSLEGGWYFGGIHGAGLAAKYYNEKLYCTYVEKITQRERLYPLFMLRFSF